MHRQDLNLFYFIECNLKQLAIYNHHLGHNVLKMNNKISSFFFATRQNNIIFNLDFTFFIYRRSLIFLIHLLKKNAKLLVINTDLALYYKINFLFNGFFDHWIFNSKKWVAGLLCGFPSQSKALTKSFIKGKKISPTKKFSFLILRKISLKKKIKQEKYESVLNLKGIFPSCVVVPAGYNNNIAITEANLLGICSIGFIDSNYTYKLPTFHIPSNDNSLLANLFFFILIRNAFLLGYFFKILKTIPYSWQYFIKKKKKT